MKKLFRLKAASLVLVAMILLLAFGTFSFAQGHRYKSPDAWSFGVHGDTQWTLNEDPAGANPEYVSASVISALNQQFISKHVRFVIQVGDLTDRAGDLGMAARATAAQSLFTYGIGFFPLRGNHETYGYLYGRDPDYNLNVPAFKSSFPQTQGQGLNLFGATNFSWPSSTGDILKGLSYAFDYNNASFVAVDVEQTSVKHQAAPNNPASCVTAITTGYGGAPAGSSCGQGYYYILSDLGGYSTGYTVYKAPQDIPHGVTNTYDSAGNQTAAAVPITITAGTWFRIDSSKRPSTNFYAWDMINPDELYNGLPFDIYDPIEDTNNRLLVIDSSANTEFWPDKQQTWIDGRLNKADRNVRAIDHAFVFSHRGIIAENHTDSFFGADPTAIQTEQNAFFSSMQNNKVKYMISGHDHLYNRALLTSPDTFSTVEQKISIGASTKFYSPADVANFPAGVKARETQISQELNTMGYYIYTVDGPRVTVDYYSTVFPAGITGFNDVYPYGEDWAAIYPLSVTPPLYFAKKESFGYSLNGKQFTVLPNASYAGISDTSAKVNSLNTTAAIVGGSNSGTDVDGNGRLYSKDVNTGWTAKNNPILASDILSLWGITDMRSTSSDVYVLQMSFQDERPNSKNKLLGNGGYRLATLNANGNWVKAVDLNINRKGEKFVQGPWNGSLVLGTHGIDMANGVVWAVVNYDADFAAVKF